MDDAETIARCTRDGVIAWQAVANMLGRSLDSVRAEHDPSYVRAYIWAPSREPRPEMDEPEPDDSMAALYRNPTRLRDLIFGKLARGPASAETVASFASVSVRQVRSRLSEFKAKGFVQRTEMSAGIRCSVWSLTEAGKLLIGRSESSVGGEGGVMGRLSTFTQEAADEICERLSKGEPLASICRDEHMPASRTVSDWTAAHPAFGADFLRARDAGFDQIAADCLTIADTPETGAETTEKEGVVETREGDMLGHRRLRIETRLKLLAKWDPRRYGEKMDLALTGVVNVVASPQDADL